MLMLEKTPKQIVQIVRELGSKTMRPSSHGYSRYGAIPIIDAAQMQIEATKQEKNAAIAVVGVVLGANRKWEKVVHPNLERMRATFPNLSFDQLRRMAAEKTWEEFKEVWGHRDEKKYRVLKQILDQIHKYKQQYPGKTDLQLMRTWVSLFELGMLSRNHPLHSEFPGCIANVGIATFQHLRITFGIDTVKPDLQVKNVLRVEFGARLSDARAIQAVEQIAEITGKSVVMIDQIFVKYGSGYYPLEAKGRGASSAAFEPRK